MSYQSIFALTNISQLAGSIYEAKSLIERAVSMQPEQPLLATKSFTVFRIGLVYESLYSSHVPASCQ